VANRPAPETDLNADFTYIDGYDAPVVTPTLGARSSQPKLFNLFRSKKSADPTGVQPVETTITAETYISLRGPQQSSIRRRDHPPPLDNPPHQLGVPQLLITAPSRLDTDDFMDADWSRGGDMRSQNPGQPQWQSQNPGQPSWQSQNQGHPPWQTMNAVDHSQPMYGRGGGGGGAFVSNGSEGWASSHQQNIEFEAFQSQSYSAAQSSSPYAGTNGWSRTLQHESSPRRSPGLGGPQRSYDDHWTADGDRTAATDSWERRKSLPSIVKMPSTPTTQTSHHVSSVSSTTNAVPLRRQPVDTYVIENGVRKRVRYETTCILSVRTTSHQRVSKYVRAINVSINDTECHFEGTTTVITGNRVRRSMSSSESRKREVTEQM